jgi:hypothetical protein
LSTCALAVSDWGIFHQGRGLIHGNGAQHGAIACIMMAVLIILHTKYELPMILPYHLNLLYFDSIMAVNLNYPCQCRCTVVFPKLKISAYLFRDLGFISVPPLPIISESVNPFPDQVGIIRDKFV